MSPRKTISACRVRVYFRSVIAAKGGKAAQLRYQKREKSALLPKMSLNIFDVYKGGGGSGGGGFERSVQLTFLVGKVDM